MLMKRSLYNSLVPLNTKLTLLYNAATDKFLVFKSGLLDCEWSYENLSPSLYATLKDGGFIVDDSKDERLEIIQTTLQANNRTDSFHLIINPTLQCNFRCWYCYEEHKYSKMGSEIICNIKKLIHNLIIQKKNLTISFFGGEPLIYYSEVWRPIIEYAKLECTSNNLKFSCNATSNGFLFTQSIIKELSQLNFNYVQITLDGNETLHNQIRYTADNHGSYRRIISNIILLVKYGIGVILRFNYTPDNIESIKDVAKEFSELSKEQRNLIHVSLHRVWQEADVDSSTLEHTISAFTKVGIAAKPTLFGEYCYADKGNSVVINYNGDLYKCTAVDFFNTPRDGYLTANGQLCWENDSLNYRISHMFSNKACHSCRIFPLCHGGCSTRPLKYPEGYCIMKYDEDKKDETILQRFLYKLRTNPIWQKVLYSSNLYKS